MLFEGEDALYVMTMAHPAHLILQNLAERALPEKNGTRLIWESLRNDGYVLMEDGSSIETYNEFLTVLHKAPNAAKHANKPAETHATYGPGDAAAIMASACIHASQLQVSTPDQAIYMIWRLAAEGIYGGPTDQNTQSIANFAFPGMKSLPPNEQLRVGLTAINDWPNIPQAALIRRVQNLMGRAST